MIIERKGDKNAKSINEFVKKHLDELVIDQNRKVSRLLDSYDGEDDYYWVLQGLFNTRHLESCVGNLIPLKGKIDKLEYKQLEREFELNGSPRQNKPTFKRIKT